MRSLREKSDRQEPPQAIGAMKRPSSLTAGGPWLRSFPCPPTGRDATTGRAGQAPTTTRSPASGSPGVREMSSRGRTKEEQLLIGNVRRPQATRACPLGWSWRERAPGPRDERVSRRPPHESPRARLRRAPHCRRNARSGSRFVPWTCREEGPGDRPCLRGSERISSVSSSLVASSISGHPAGGGAMAVVSSPKPLYDRGISKSGSIEDAACNLRARNPPRS